MCTKIWRYLTSASCSECLVLRAWLPAWRNVSDFHRVHSLDKYRQSIFFCGYREVWTVSIFKSSFRRDNFCSIVAGAHVISRCGTIFEAVILLLWTCPDYILPPSTHLSESIIHFGKLRTILNWRLYMQRTAFSATLLDFEQAHFIFPRNTSRCPEQHFS